MNIALFFMSTKMYTYNFYIYREKKNRGIYTCYILSDPTSVLKHHLTFLG